MSGLNQVPAMIRAKAAPERAINIFVERNCVHKWDKKKSSLNYVSKDSTKYFSVRREGEIYQMMTTIQENRDVSRDKYLTNKSILTYVRQVVVVETAQKLRIKSQKSLSQDITLYDSFVPVSTWLHAISITKSTKSINKSHPHSISGIMKKK